MGRGRFKKYWNDLHTYWWKGTSFARLKDLKFRVPESCPYDEHRWKSIGERHEECVKCDAERTWEEGDW